ncbi:MFS transporter [Thalassotalea castellviae]|uniref:MFS transporter n=1 Tax=Thalassotalea castellviae TaxID=3075612 RepID=A0ABU3A139_9GAMM|nr:MFS transporter [Thalassotalea sp. W431]MDT0603889.1 MFS transporter [Thalassotalea sp. W431]
MIVNRDPREIIDNSKMSSLQVLVIFITVCLGALDGFDLLSISFAAPGIASEWQINRVSLGVVLSMELIGMGFGSILLGGIADKLGRRRTILVCLTLMSISMFLSTTSASVFELSIWRVFTGFGIGGMLTSINAIAAEYANAKFRSLCVSLVAAGYPIGGAIGGTIASVLLVDYDWRSVFYLGTFATILFIPLVYFLVPESIHWLTSKQPDNALAKINKILVRIRQNPISHLPDISEKISHQSIKDIFSKSLVKITILISLLYIFHVSTFYFILKWMPKIVVDMGFNSSEASSVLVWANIGGILGAVLFSLLTLRFGLKALMTSVLALSALFVTLLGQMNANLTHLSLMSAIAHFFTNASMVGMYALFTQIFPTHVRAFGTGFCIGIGRAGSVLSPILAGYLFSLNLAFSQVAFFMSLGSCLALFILVFISLNANIKQ